MSDSIDLSIKRIREWGPDNPMLYHDALKLAEALDPDPTNDPEYLAFCAEQAKRCRCEPVYARPCGGLLAGGFCDELGLTDLDT